MAYATKRPVDSPTLPTDEPMAVIHRETPPAGKDAVMAADTSKRRKKLDEDIDKQS